MISKKVLITGSFGVGKTSLFTRFIHNEFSDNYRTTIGVQVDKKVVKLGGKEMSLILWDIAGEVSQEKVPRSYFLGASAVIYVVDLSRPMTFNGLVGDLKFLNKVLPECLVRKVGNKKDLLSPKNLNEISRRLNLDVYTSAKTGENVEALFMEIAQKLM